MNTPGPSVNAPARLLGLAVLLVWSAAAQDFSQIHVEKVAGGYRYTEGPVWSREGFLLFSDVPSGRIVKLTPGEAELSVFRDDAHGTYGNTYDSRGRLYSCEGGSRRVIRSEKKGKIEVLAERWDGKRLNAPNDIAVRRDGHAWFTDPAFGSERDTRELDFHGIYHLTPKGQLELAARWAQRPNGIALSPNGRTLYVGNSDERSVHAWDLDREGQASNERTLIRSIDGIPGGIKTDEKGNLYVAARGVAVYTAEGRPLIVIPIGEKPSNLAFGDADSQGLYITARSSLYRIRLDVKGSVP